MGWNLVSLSDIAPHPWLNGGGTTRELVAWPDPAEWRLRLSVAEVAKDGPFSLYPGVQRWFAVLRGAGVRLSVAGRVHELGKRSPPLNFDGGVPVDCKLIGSATQDFNLMARGGPARLTRIENVMSGTAPSASVVAVYANGSAAMLRWGFEYSELQPRTLAWRIADGGTAVRVAAVDALWMEFRP
ncbi:MAG TPA: HutD family protein [Ramlibacter sp.]|nr:HutD family protein [Ramlibacter sp.]